MYDSPAFLRGGLVQASHRVSLAEIGLVFVYEEAEVQFEHGLGDGTL